MTDKTTLQSDDDGKIDKQNDDRTIFAEQFEMLMNGFGEECEKQNIETAIAIALHPKEKIPMIFMRGNQYEVATMLTRILRELREDIIKNVTV